jgi:hypothetical protein
MHRNQYKFAFNYDAAVSWLVREGIFTDNICIRAIPAAATTPSSVIQAHSQPLLIIWKEINSKKSN